MQLKRRQFVLGTLGGASLLPFHFDSRPALGATTADALSTSTARLGAPVSPTPRLVRDFQNPRLELIRLIKEVAEIELSLMAQYLYGAASLKPAFEAVCGYGVPAGDTLLGIAIQEMQHLSAANRFLAELGCPPSLGLYDFPYETDIYPFPFELEPLTPRALAKYIYAEAPNDRVIPRSVLAHLPHRDGFNHVGSVFDAVLGLLRDNAFNHLATRDAWIERFEGIKEEGEADHFRFFLTAFEGTHPGFSGENPWLASPGSDAYPSWPGLTNPTAYRGHRNEIADPDALHLAWLSNLHYWSVLVLMDSHYRGGSEDLRHLAIGLMMGPFWSLARHLARVGAGAPFDNLSIGYGFGHDQALRLAFARDFLSEAAALAAAKSAILPVDYPEGMERETVAQLQRLIT